MVQFKLFVAFIFAAAAIAPVDALPYRHGAPKKNQVIPAAKIITSSTNNHHDHDHEPAWGEPGSKYYKNGNRKPNYSSATYRQSIGY